MDMSSSSLVVLNTQFLSSLEKTVQHWSPLLREHLHENSAVDDVGVEEEGAGVDVVADTQRPEGTTNSTGSTVTGVNVSAS